MLFYTADPDLRQDPAFPYVAAVCPSGLCKNCSLLNLRGLTTTPEAVSAKNWGRMRIGKENDIQDSYVRGSGYGILVKKKRE